MKAHYTPKFTSKIKFTRMFIPIVMFITSVTKCQIVKFDIKFLDPHCLSQQLTKYCYNSHENLWGNYTSNKNTNDKTMRESIMKMSKNNINRKNYTDEEKISYYMNKRKGKKKFANYNYKATNIKNLQKPEDKILKKENVNEKFANYNINEVKDIESNKPGDKIPEKEKNDNKFANYNENPKDTQKLQKLGDKIPEKEKNDNKFANYNNN